jgi:hypothetical protein
MPLENKPLLSCILCEEKFCVGDVKAGRFFATSMVCRGCYERGKQSPYEIWCFGKPSLVDGNGKVEEFGYSEQAEECQSMCPDRKVCRQFVGGHSGEDDT